MSDHLIGKRPSWWRPFARRRWDRELKAWKDGGGAVYAAASENERRLPARDPRSIAAGLIDRRTAARQSTAEDALFRMALHVDSLNGGGAVYSLAYAPKKETP